MSQAEIERFVADVKSNADLLAELQQQTGELDSIVGFVRSKGYDVTPDEAKAYSDARSGKELSDEQLDAVAGGVDKGGWFKKYLEDD